MKIVVTGALGHIGSSLIRCLKADEVVLIDNLETQRYCSLFDLPGSGVRTFVEADVTTANLPALIKGAAAVVHLAAITDAAGSFGKVDAIERVNVEGTRKVALACIETGTPMVFASTTSVYGSQTEVVDETATDEDLKPQSPYASSKLQGEKILQGLKAQGLRFICFRFGTIFGVSPGMRFHTAINKFCWQASLGLPLTVWSTAMNQVRPYLDLVDANAAIAFALSKNLFDGEIYNVVTVNASVADVVASIREYIPGLTVNLVDHRIMNQLSYDVQNTKIIAKGFRVKGNMKLAIGETLALLKTLQRGKGEGIGISAHS